MKIVCVDRKVMIMIWARGDRPCEICLIYDGALRSSAQTRGDRPCRYMDLASPPWVMNSRWFSSSIMYIRLRKKLVFWGISLHRVVLHCIPWNPSFLMIMYFISGCKVLDIWLPICNELDLVYFRYCECFCGDCNWWILSLLLRYVLVDGELLGWAGFM